MQDKILGFDYEESYSYEIYHPRSLASHSISAGTGQSLESGDEREKLTPIPVIVSKSLLSEHSIKKGDGMPNKMEESGKVSLLKND